MKANYWFNRNRLLSGLRFVTALLLVPSVLFISANSFAADPAQLPRSISPARAQAIQGITADGLTQKNALAISVVRSGDVADDWRVASARTDHLLRYAVAQPTERQRIGNQIDGAMMRTRAA